MFQKPSSFNARASDSSMILSWKAPPLGGGAHSISGYIVDVAPDDATNITVAGTTAAVLGLQSNKRYMIKVAVNDSDARKEFADPLNVTTGNATMTCRSSLLY